MKIALKRFIANMPWGRLKVCYHFNSSRLWHLNEIIAADLFKLLGSANQDKHLRTDGRPIAALLFHSTDRVMRIVPCCGW